MAEALKRVAFVVDDNRMVARLFSRMLEDENFEVIRARDGSEALYMLANSDSSMIERIAVIFSDIDMPKMNGVKLLEHLKKQPILSKLPFVFYSANSNMHELFNALATGPDDLLLKPISPEKLATCLEKLHLSMQAP